MTSTKLALPPLPTPPADPRKRPARARKRPALPAEPTVLGEPSIAAPERLVDRARAIQRAMADAVDAGNLAALPALVASLGQALRRSRA